MAAVVAILLVPVSAAYASTLTVTSTADSGAGSLRATIASAAAGDTVLVPTGHYILSSGEIPITQPITVAGDGASLSVIDAQGSSRVFHITASAGGSGGRVTFNGVQITGGNTTSQPGGGGILVDSGGGDLSLVNTVVSGNTVNVVMDTTAAGGGGGVYNAGGATTVTGSSISGNTATVTTSGTGLHGGGGLLGNAGAISIVNSHLDANQLTVNGPSTSDDSTTNVGHWCCDGGGALRQVGAAPTSISNSTVNSNTATIASGDGGHGGGAIAIGTPMLSNESLTIDSSTLRDNATTVTSTSGLSGGGAIQFNPDTDALPASVLAVTNSLIDANSASLPGTPPRSGGGGIFDNNAGDSFVNATITGNSTDAHGPGSGGGGVWILGQFPNMIDTLANVTIANNSASSSRGGGLLAGSGASVRIKNSIVALNGALAGSNCSGSVSSGGYNLEDLPGSCGLSGAGDQVLSASSIGLLPLADNGGPTMTQALASSSAAIDSGNPTGCTDPSGALLRVDQRGFARPSGPRCDIGAFEYGEHVLTVVVHGSGTVTGPGISCPGTCSHIYPAGSTVSLTGTPAAGSAAGVWTGPCSGTTTCDVTLTSDQTVGISFAPLGSPTTVSNGGTTASGGGGATGGSQPSNPTGHTPRCTLTLKSNRVLLTAHRSKRATGVLKLAVLCDRAAKVNLSGTLTQVLKKLGSHRLRSLTLPALAGSVRAHRAAVFVEKLPQQALAALRAGVRESVVFKLLAVASHGRTTLTSHPVGLVGVG